MKKYFLLVSLFILSLTTPVFAFPQPNTSDEVEYMNEVMNTSLEVTVSSAEANDAWGRAQSFVGKYSNMKIQIATDFVIQTYNPEAFSEKYGYYIVKTKNDDGNYSFQVECTGNGIFSNKDKLANQQILAYYIKTNKIMPKFVTH